MKRHPNDEPLEIAPFKRPYRHGGNFESASNLIPSEIWEEIVSYLHFCPRDLLALSDTNSLLKKMCRDYVVKKYDVHWCLAQTHPHPEMPTWHFRQTHPCSEVLTEHRLSVMSEKAVHFRLVQMLAASTTYLSLQSVSMGHYNVNNSVLSLFSNLTSLSTIRSKENQIILCDPDCYLDNDFIFNEPGAPLFQFCFNDDLVSHLTNLKSLILTIPIKDTSPGCFTNLVNLKKLSLYNHRGEEPLIYSTLTNLKTLRLCCCNENAYSQIHTSSRLQNLLVYGKGAQPHDVFRLSNLKALALCYGSFSILGSTEHADDTYPRLTNIKELCLHGLNTYNFDVPQRTPAFRNLSRMLPNVSKLHLECCHLFDDDLKQFSKLESLCLDRCYNKDLNSHSFPSSFSSFGKLQELMVEYPYQSKTLNGIEKDIKKDSPTYLPQLRELTVSELHPSIKADECYACDSKVYLKTCEGFVHTDGKTSLFRHQVDSFCCGW